MAAASSADVTAAAAAKAAEGSASSGFNAGDCVEVFGLDSESGRLMNGHIGVITGFSSEGARVEVQLASGGEANLKPNNLRRLEFQPVDCVEVFGLTSDEGKQINGRVGVIVRFVRETARYEVHFASGQRANFKPANLRRPGSSPGAAASQREAVAAEGEEPEEKVEEQTEEQTGDAAAKPTKGKVGGQGRGRGRPRKEAQAPGKTKAQEECEESQGEPAAKRKKGAGVAAKEAGEEKPEADKNKDAKKNAKPAVEKKDAAKAGEREAKADANVEGDAPNAQQGSSAGNAPATPKPQRKRRAAREEKEEQPSRKDGDASGVKRGRPRKSKDTASLAKGDEKAKPAEGSEPAVAESKEKPATPAPQRRGGANKGKPAAAAAGGLDSKVLAEAEALGMAGALRNLAARGIIVEQGISGAALLKALQQADGLVNKAKAILLGST